MKFLVSAGADVTAHDHRALEWATQFGHLEVVKFLVSAGADVTAQDHEALKCAALDGHLEVVKVLIEAGVSAEAKNKALEFAALDGHLEVVKVLIEAGVSAEAKNKALKCTAERFGHLEVVKFLVSAGANRDHEALKRAALDGHLEVVKFLLCDKKVAEDVSNDLLVLRQNDALDVKKIASSVLEAYKFVEENPMTRGFRDSLLDKGEKLSAMLKKNSSFDASIVKFVVLREYLAGQDLDINWAFGTNLSNIVKFLGISDIETLKKVSDCDNPDQVLEKMIPFHTFVSAKSFVYQDNQKKTNQEFKLDLDAKSHIGEFLVENPGESAVIGQIVQSVSVAQAQE